MAGTVGDIRASVAELGARAWTVAEHLADDDPLPEHPLGAEVADYPLADDTVRLDVGALLARRLQSPFARARSGQIEVAGLEAAALTRVDWRDRWGGRWLATIQDQSPCDNCWAFASAALVEAMVRIEHGVWAKRSEGDVRDGWGGPSGENWVVRDNVAPCAHSAGVTGALDWIQRNGVADPGCYAWSASDRTYAPTPDRAGRTVRVPKYQVIGNVQDQKRWLDTVGPIIAGFDVYSDFDVWAGPQVYRRSMAATKRGVHFVLVVGFDDDLDCWIIRNSWGTTWGTGGYGLLGYGECDIDKKAKLGLRNTNPDPWSKRRLHAGNVLESGNGPQHRNFELLRGGAPRARHLWRDGGDGGFRWHEAAMLENADDIGAGAGCVGHPAITATTYDRNFEAAYWEVSGRLRYWWMEQASHTWRDGGRFGPTDTEGYPGFIQSNFGAPGNLEVVVRRRGGELVHWWREGPPSFRWHDGGRIATGVKMSGPALVQADVGVRGNLYVVAVTAFGSLQLHWRDDDGDGRWHAGEVFGARVGATPVCMIQGGFGAVDERTPGNFELCVAVEGQVQHWWRDNRALPGERPRHDEPDPRVSPRVRDTGPPDLGSLLPRNRRAVIDGAPPGIRDLLTGTDGDGRLSSSISASIGSVVLAGASPTRDVGTDRWHHAATFGANVKHVWGLLQGSFGFNLEAIVETEDGGLRHYYRDGTGWNEGVLIEA